MRIGQWQCGICTLFHFTTQKLNIPKAGLLLLGVLCCRSPHPTKHKNAVCRQIDRPCSQVCYLQQHSPRATTCSSPHAVTDGPSCTSPALSCALLPDHLGHKGHRFCSQIHWCWCSDSRSSRIWSGYRNSVRLPYHRLRQEPLPQATAVLLRHLGFRPFRGYGSLLSYDGVPAVVRFLSYLLLRTLQLPSHKMRFQCILSGVDGHGIECVETSPS